MVFLSRHSRENRTLLEMSQSSKLDSKQQTVDDDDEIDDWWVADTPRDRRVNF
jgi:hypothetical protein